MHYLRIPATYHLSLERWWGVNLMRYATGSFLPSARVCFIRRTASPSAILPRLMSCYKKKRNWLYVRPLWLETTLIEPTTSGTLIWRSLVKVGCSQLFFAQTQTKKITSPHRFLWYICLLAMFDMRGSYTTHYSLLAAYCATAPCKPLNGAKD